MRIPLHLGKHIIGQRGLAPGRGTINVDAFDMIFHQTREDEIQDFRGGRCDNTGAVGDRIRQIIIEQMSCYLAPFFHQITEITLHIRTIQSEAIIDGRGDHRVKIIRQCHAPLLRWIEISSIDVTCEFGMGVFLGDNLRNLTI